MSGEIVEKAGNVGVLEEFATQLDVVGELVAEVGHHVAGQLGEGLGAGAVHLEGAVQPLARGAIQVLELLRQSSALLGRRLGVVGELLQ